MSEIAGKVDFQDIVEGENVREDTDRVTGLVAARHRRGLARTKNESPAMVVKGKGGAEKRYLLPSGSHSGGQRR